MKIAKTYRKSPLPIAPQRIGNYIGIALPKMPQFPQISDAHTIAALRRLEPLKKIIFEELERQTMSGLRSP